MKIKISSQSATEMQLEAAKDGGGVGGVNRAHAVHKMFLSARKPGQGAGGEGEGGETAGNRQRTGVKEQLAAGDATAAKKRDQRKVAAASSSSPSPSSSSTLSSLSAALSTASAWGAALEPTATAGHA